MLQLSHHSISGKIEVNRYTSLSTVEGRNSSKKLIQTLSVIMLVSVLVMFLPWTQNITTTGNLTTLLPDQRPQTIHSVIPGQVEKWYVQEGDYVNTGDTILFIREIKAEYFDPMLIQRTQDQLDAKKNTLTAYQQKVIALDVQIEALTTNREFKLEQNRNKIEQSILKVQSDSIDLEAAKLNRSIALEQFRRMEELYAGGLNSLTQYEKRKNDLQKAEADLISKQNKLLTSENELINARIQLTSTDADFREKIAKSQSEMFTAQSDMFKTRGEIAKLENQLANYTYRNQFYYVLAPQAGYITETLVTGIGETIKEGDPILSIMPSDFELAVEMYVRPIDLPLLEKGQEVRIQFDGWPAIVFSGWPNTSFGTYGGSVFAIDNFISKNGMYRVLVQRDPNDRDWPDALRYGSGARSIVLFKDVPIWYETWRQINGFPPDYYKSSESGSSTVATSGGGKK